MCARCAIYADNKRCLACVCKTVVESSHAWPLLRIDMTIGIQLMRQRVVGTIHWMFDIRVITRVT